MLVAVTVSLVAAPPAGALTPIEPDNKPLPVWGYSNGQLPGHELLQVSPTCVAERQAAPSLAALLGAAIMAGVPIRASDCYRDYAGQVYWRDYWCARGHCEYAAVPGTSNHGWGRAVDLGVPGSSMSFDSPTYAWLKANAWKYGWNHPGWAEPDGAAPEPWHWEWVGNGGTKYPGLVYPTPLGTGLVIGGNPIGALDNVTPGRPGWIDVNGWAIDPDIVDPAGIHIYVDGTLTGTANADQHRGDVGYVFPGYGPAHGYSLSVKAASGVHRVCAYALNTGMGAHSSLGCRDVHVTGLPIGNLDEVRIESRIAGATLRARGWALDPDTASSIGVHVYVDATGAAALANRTRADIATAFPGYGYAHGFDLAMPVGHGPHAVCAYGINTGYGSANASIGCQTIRVDRNPVGNLDWVHVERNGQATIAGWTLDPDTAAPTAAHIYVDGKMAAAVGATADRPDVGAAYPEHGAAHGFVWGGVLSHGQHTICAYGINTGAGDANPWLGCKVVRVDLNPIGNQEPLTVSGPGTIVVNGWALDPDVLEPTEVHVYRDGVGAAILRADQLRPDVGAAFPAYGPSHGYRTTLAVKPGQHWVCAYGINRGGGSSNSLLGCVTVNVF